MRICICISGHLKKLFRIFILFFLSFFFPKIASSILNETGIRIFSLDASDQRAKMSLRYASYAYKHKSHDRSKNSRWLSFGTLTIIILVLAIFMYSLNDGTHVKKKKRNLDRAFSNFSPTNLQRCNLSLRFFFLFLIIIIIGGRFNTINFLLLVSWESLVISS